MTSEHVNWSTSHLQFKALFSAAVVLLAEKVFVQYVAIQFHKKALSDRLETNRLGLKALDHLSNADPANDRSVHNANLEAPKPSRTNSIEVRADDGPDKDSEGLNNTIKGESTIEKDRLSKRSVIKTVFVDTIGKALSQVVLRDSKLNRENEIGSTWNARRLARRLFSILNSVHPDNQYVTVDGICFFKTSSIRPTF